MQKRMRTIGVTAAIVLGIAGVWIGLQAVGAATADYTGQAHTACERKIAAELGHMPRTGNLTVEGDRQGPWTFTGTADGHTYRCDVYGKRDFYLVDLTLD